MCAVDKRRSAEPEQARARTEDFMKIVVSAHSETPAARVLLNVVLHAIQERQAGHQKVCHGPLGPALSGERAYLKRRTGKRRLRSASYWGGRYT